MGATAGGVPEESMWGERRQVPVWVQGNSWVKERSNARVGLPKRMGEEQEKEKKRKWGRGKAVGLFACWLSCIPALFLPGPGVVVGGGAKGGGEGEEGE